MLVVAMVVKWGWRWRTSGGGSGGGMAVERAGAVTGLVVVAGYRAMATATVSVEGTGINQPNLE
jgi:hypothetical protein